MSLITIIFIAIGLSMDAFAVSLTGGLKAREEEKSKVAIKSAIYFGGFQGIMPVIGWFLGTNFRGYIEKIDHWIAFLLLVFIGVKMLKEAYDKDEDECCNENCFTNKRFIILAIATSIDALAVGVSFAFLNVNIISSALIIALVTGIFSFIAVYIGKFFGILLKKRAEIFGGVILIFIGVKILLEHIL